MSTKRPPKQAASPADVVRPGAPSAEQLADLERLLSLCEVQAVPSGVPFPLGAQRRGNGVNFAIFSRHQGPR